MTLIHVRSPPASFQFAAATRGPCRAWLPRPGPRPAGTEDGRASAVLLRGLKKQARDMAAHALCGAAAPIAGDPRSRSITTRTARSGSRPSWRCGPTARASSRSPSSISAGIFQKPVRMHVVEKRAGARDRLRPRLFRHAGGFARPRWPARQFGLRRLPLPGGRATASSTGSKNDWVAFLGASYFRAIGELYQYGLSARGLADRRRGLRQDRGIPGLHPCLLRNAAAGSDTVTVYALLDGPSVAGAYRFLMQRAKCVDHGYRQHDLHAPGRRAASASRR